MRIWSTRNKVATGLLVLILLIVVGSVSFNKDTASTTRPGSVPFPEAASSVPTPTTLSDAQTLPGTPTVPKPSFSDGTFEVGKDIEAGTYRSAIPTDGLCYWARLNGFGGSDIINNGTSSNGPSIVTIHPTDKGFQSKGCGAWVKS